ncbi:MAG TPA: Ada metal-binding domain-containing protein [Actinomycetes bacterium]|nr:Ada metal-binding domain-containing protein [Actinomycetes bacterium]
MLTTGIHCRPEPGARPRPDHVLAFPQAAAAEAAGALPVFCLDLPAWLQPRGHPARTNPCRHAR